MSRSLALRLLLAIAALLLLGGLLAFALNGIDRLLDLWERALAASPIIAGAYGLLLLFFTGAALALLWWILRPARKRKPKPEIPTEQELSQRLAQNEKLGLDVTDAQDELSELARRREAGELHIALYGQISAGKSSLVRALLPNAQVTTDVRGGTTRDLQRHIWESPGGDKITLTDAPGFNSDQDADTTLAREEAVRAHVVIYVCEGDLTRDQWQALESLMKFGKPLMLAINKIDRLSSGELKQIRKSISHRLKDQPLVSVVAVQTGGTQEVMRELPNGERERINRPRPAQVDELLDALQSQLETRTQALANLRDSAVLQLASGKLDVALDSQRRERADELVRTYTRRAVLGALAALTPGSDLVIQGVLGTQFVRELCTLYDIQPRDLQIEKLLKSANRKLRRNSALVLAVAGNGLKAFPGIGTVSGGLMHAVAYGLLFDTLGRAMVHSLRTRGELEPESTARVFENMLDEDLLPRARRLARLALKREPGA